MPSPRDQLCSIGLSSGGPTEHAYEGDDYGSEQDEEQKLRQGNAADDGDENEECYE